MAPKDPSNGLDRYGAEVAQFSVRMPDDLHGRIKAVAAQAGVSLNVWLCLAAAEKAAGSLRSGDVQRLDELERLLADCRERLDALEEQ